MNCYIFLDTSESLKILLFVLDRRQIIAEAMPALRIVEHPDSRIRPAFFSHECRTFASNSFALEQLEEALGNGIIIAITASTHGLLKIVRAYLMWEYGNEVPDQVAL